MLCRCQMQRLRSWWGYPVKGDHVFINGNDQAISNMAMLQLMKGMGVDATPHGMRSAFNTWAKNQTNFAPETRNAALAHSEEKLEAAYTRDKNRLMFDKRRRLMDAWSSYLAAPMTGAAGIKFARQSDQSNCAEPWGGLWFDWEGMWIARWGQPFWLG